MTLPFAKVENRRWPVWVTGATLLAALVVASMSQTLIYAVLPPLGRKMGIPDIWISSISGLSALCFTVAAPFLGAASERLGRAPLIYGGLLTSIVTNLLFALIVESRLAGSISAVVAFALLVTSRMLLSIAWAGMFPAAQAYVADTVPPERRASGIVLIDAAFNIGVITGPLLAWVPWGIDATSPFYSVSTLTSVALLAAIIFMPRTGGSAPQVGRQVRYWVSEIPPSMYRFLIVGMVVVLSSTLVQQLAAFRMQDIYQLSEAEATRWAGLALTAYAAASMSAQFLSGALAARRLHAFGAHEMMKVGCGIAIVGIGLMVALPSAAYVTQTLAIAIYGAGLGLLSPGNATAMTLMAGADGQGKAAGLLSAARGVGVMIGPVLGTTLYQWSWNAPYVAVMIVLITVYIVVMLPKVANRSHD